MADIILSTQFQSYLVQLIDSHRDINNLISLTNNLCDTCQDLTVVHLDAHTDAKTVIHLIHNLEQFYLADQGIRTYHVTVALIELTIASLLRTVGTPYRLNLITLKRETDLIAMLHNKTCKRNGQVVTQSLFTSLRCELQWILTLQVFIGNTGKAIS